MNLGWHLCSKCGKNAYYMCYTCTFSLCKNCIKDSVIFCVRGKKGFCEPCMRIVKLIEDSLKGDKDMVPTMFCSIIFPPMYCKLTTICKFTDSYSHTTVSGISLFYEYTYKQCRTNFCQSNIQVLFWFISFNVLLPFCVGAYKD